MRILTTILIILFVVLQLRLWFGEGSISYVFSLKSKVQEQEQINQQWHDKNELLAAEVLDLQKGSEAIEEYARTELGMIKKDETFFLVVKPQ